MSQRHASLPGSDCFNIPAILAMSTNTYHISELLPGILTEFAAREGRQVCIEMTVPVSHPRTDPNSMRDSHAKPALSSRRSNALPQPS